jgi:3-hydroxymyristoyl/3-hydroxydecanoyl-(acyl carrier protein) dehydratase
MIATTHRYPFLLIDRVIDIRGADANGGSAALRPLIRLRSYFWLRPSFWHSQHATLDEMRAANRQ